MTDTNTDRQLPGGAAFESCPPGSQRRPRSRLAGRRRGAHSPSNHRPRAVYPHTHADSHDGSTDRPTDRPTDRSTDPPTDRLTDRRTDCPTATHPATAVAQSSCALRTMRACEGALFRLHGATEVARPNRCPRPRTVADSKARLRSAHGTVRDVCCARRLVSCGCGISGRPSEGTRGTPT